MKNLDMLNRLGLCLLLATGTADAAELRVMSFNILADPGTAGATDPNRWAYTAGPNRRDRAVRVIADTTPDIAGIQEADLADWLGGRARP